MGAVTFANTGGSLEVKFSACTREPLSWKEELYAAARSVTSRTNKPLWLCSSGGIDSEVMCQAFYDQGINFSVLTLSHKGGTNERDVALVRAWCKKHEIHQEIVTIDLQEFFGSDIFEYIDQGYIADLPFRYLQIRLMEIAEKFGGFAVLAGGGQYYKVDSRKPELSRKDVFLEFDAGNAIPLDWIERNATAHEPYFMYSTPELCLSYLRIPLVDFVLEHPEILRHPSNPFTMKRFVFQSIWADHVSRINYRSFEKIGPQTVAVKEKLRERFSGRLPSYRMPVPEFSTQLSIKASA